MYVEDPRKGVFFLYGACGTAAPCMRDPGCFRRGEAFEPIGRLCDRPRPAVDAAGARVLHEHVSARAR